MSSGVNCDPYAEEISQLRALLSGGGINNNVLEGRYMNQLRRARQLGVQLESERSRSRQLAAQLAALQEKETKRSGGNNNNHNNNNNCERSEEQRGVTAVLKERLDRAYAQLNESKLQLEEQRRVLLRLRKILQQEIGGTPQELEALLKNATDGDNNINKGWRGRAQQIVLLKGKVKELERTLAAAVPNNNNSGGASPHSDGVSSGSAHVCLQARGGGGGSVATGATTTTAARPRDLDDVARDHVAGLQSRRLLQQRELLEELNKRAAEVEAQRRRADAAQARQVNLEADNHALRECLQTVMSKTENDNALIDAYKEEVERLRQALHDAELKLHEWGTWEEETGHAGGRGRREKGETGKLHHSANDSTIDTNTAATLAGADAAILVNRLMVENQELRCRLARYESNENKSQKSSSPSGGGGGGGRSKGKSNQSHAGSEGSRGADDDMALVMHWLRGVAPFPSAAAGNNKNNNNNNNNDVWQSRVAEVLRRAHDAVRLLEQQREEDGRRLSKCYEALQEEQKKRGGGSKKGKKNKDSGANNNNKSDDDDDSGTVMMNVLVQENRALKLRIKTLQELMEKEQAAYESLLAAASTSCMQNETTTVRPSRTPAEAATVSSGKKDGVGRVTAEEYEKLQSQYEELRCAFNTLQKQRLRGGGT